jgi:hypothetical protein
MRRRPRLNSASLEELLDGGRIADAAVSRVVSAARAPATPEELAGLDATRSAFHRSSQAWGRRPIGSVPAATRTAAGRLLALKVIAAVGGASLIGGAAYAATNTQLLGGGTKHHHGPSQQAPGAGQGSSPWNQGTQPPGSQSSVSTGQPSDRPSHTHPSPSNAFGTSVASSVRAGHPTSRPTTQPAPTHTSPSPTLPGNAKTTPPARPTDNPRPAPTNPGGRP